jgi:hypothetical protein
LYSKIITEEIVRLQANGFTAEETREYLKENHQISIGLNTVYRHRHSPVGVEMLQELIRHQERSILKADSTSPALAMKYRDKLIEKMINKIMPDLVYSKAEVKSESTEQVNINVTTNLRDYEKTIRAAVERDFQLHNTKQQLPTPQTNTKTS